MKNKLEYMIIGPEIFTVQQHQIVETRIVFNYYYQTHGYHPLLCYNGLTGDLLKAELRDGTTYCSKEADLFIKSLLEEFIDDFPDILLYLRGDSGFASPGLYEVLEDKNCKYAIRLKENAKLRELAEEANQALYRATKFN